MRQTRVLLVAAVAALTAGACAESMTDEMREELAAARVENDRHHAGAAAAASMAAMMAELARHEEAMDGIMDGMGDTLGHMSTSMAMSRCAGSGMEQMMGTMGGMRAEMTRHRSELEAAPGLGAAQGECVAHFAALSDMLDVMDVGLAGMGMRCGM